MAYHCPGHTVICHNLIGLRPAPVVCLCSGVKENFMITTKSQTIMHFVPNCTDTLADFYVCSDQKVSTSIPVFPNFMLKCKLSLIENVLQATTMLMRNQERAARVGRMGGVDAGPGGVDAGPGCVEAGSGGVEAGTDLLSTAQPTRILACRRVQRCAEQGYRGCAPHRLLQRCAAGRSRNGPRPGEDTLQQHFPLPAGEDQKAEDVGGEGEGEAGATAAAAAVKPVCQPANLERWHDVDVQDITPQQPTFRPTRSPGPQLICTATYTVLQLFQLFFTNSILQTIIQNTNDFGSIHYSTPTNPWIDVTLQDMFSFMSMVLYMGVIKCCAFTDYWRQRKLYSLLFPSRVITGKKFLRISRALHLSSLVADASNEQRKGTAAFD